MLNPKDIDEIYLYSIWLSSGRNLTLKAIANCVVEILDFGEINTDDGADLINAKVKINGKTYCGDVEISYEVVNDTLSEVVLVPEYFYDGSWRRA